MYGNKCLYGMVVGSGAHKAKGCELESPWLHFCGMN